MGHAREGEHSIEGIRAAAQIVARVLSELGRAVRPGITTAELDRIAETLIRDQGGRPAFKGYRGFPASICPSINEEVVHGIPGPRTLAEGDIVGMDGGVEKEGYYGDEAWRFPGGRVGPEVGGLGRVTREGWRGGVGEAEGCVG